MRVEIDQSGKIADTKLPTVLAFSDGISYSIIVSSKTKRELIKELRMIKEARVFYFQLFAVLLFILVKDFLIQLDSIFIDQEYQGREKDIKAYFIDVCVGRKREIDPDSIHFTHVGKYSKAHLKAIEALRNKKADKQIRFAEIMSYFIPKKNDRGPNR